MRRYRSGGSKGSRDRSATNYGAVRPGEGLGNGERSPETLLKATNFKIIGDGGSTRSGGGGGGSGSGESVTTEPVEGVNQPDPFTITDGGTYDLTLGYDDEVGGVVLDFWAWRGTAPNVYMQYGRLVVQHDGTNIEVLPVTLALETRDSGFEENITWSVAINGSNEVVLTWTASTDATRGDIDVRVLFSSVPARPV